MIAWGRANSEAFRILVSQLAAAGGAFVASLLYAAVLGPTGRGEVAWVLQIAYVVGLAAFLGYEQVLITHGRPAGADTWTHFRQAVKGVVGNRRSTVLILFCLSLALVAVELDWSLAAAGLVFLIGNAAFRLLRPLLIASGHASWLLALVIASQVVVIVGGLILWTWDAAATPLIAIGIYSLSSVPAITLIGRSLVKGESSRGDRASTFDLLGLRAKRFRIGGLSQAVSSRADRLLLAPIAGASSLGQYSVAATLSELVAWPMIAYCESRAAIWGERPPSVREGGAVLAIGLSGGLAVGVAGPSVIRTLLGEDFFPAAELVPVLTAAGVALGTYRSLSVLLIAMRREEEATKLEVVGAVVAIGLYLVLIPLHGALGAAVGSLTAYAASGLVGARLVLNASRTSPAHDAHDS